MITFTPQTQELQAKFAELTSSSPAMKAAVMAFARVLRTRIQLGFRNAQAPGGGAWKPLNPFFRTGKPLRDTGRLYGSIQAKADGDAVLVGTNLRTPGGGHSLGAIHQYGATVEPKKVGGLLGPIKSTKGFVFIRRAVIPARPFMPLDGAGNVALPPAWEKSAMAAMGRALGLGA